MTKKQQKAKNAISRVTVDMNLSTKVFKDKKHPSRNDRKNALRKEIINYAQYYRGGLRSCLSQCD